MKIGYFVSNFHTGGESTVAKNIVKQMGEKGHEVYVFAPDSQEQTEFPKFDSNTHIHLYEPTYVPALAKTPISLQMFYKPLKFDLDIVQGFLGTPQGLFTSSLYAAKNQVPLVHFYHHDWKSSFHPDLTRKALVKSSNLLLPKMLDSFPDKVIVPSKEYINESRYLPKIDSKIRVVHNGIDLNEWRSIDSDDPREELNLSPNDSVLLFVGTITKRKGLKHLLRALEIIIEEYPSTKLIIVGKGDNEQEVREKAERLEINDNVRFAGFVSERTKKLYYDAADIFVLPSLPGGECFPNVNLEAMASGLPVIATNVGGNPEAIKDGKNGIIVPPKNSTQLSKAIRKLFDDNQTREMMSSNNLKRIEMFEWEEIADQTEDLYYGLLNNNRVN